MQGAVNTLNDNKQASCWYLVVSRTRDCETEIRSQTTNVSNQKSPRFLWCVSLFLFCSWVMLTMKELLISCQDCLLSKRGSVFNWMHHQLLNFLQLCSLPVLHPISSMFGGKMQSITEQCQSSLNGTQQDPFKANLRGPLKTVCIIRNSLSGPNISIFPVQGESNVEKCIYVIQKFVLTEFVLKEFYCCYFMKTKPNYLT